MKEEGSSGGEKSGSPIVEKLYICLCLSVGLSTKNISRDLTLKRLSQFLGSVRGTILTIIGIILILMTTIDDDYAIKVISNQDTWLHI